MRQKLSPRARALALFSIRPRSCCEIKTKLLQLGEVNVEAILNEFTKAGLLDDTRFTRWFVASRMSSRPRSKKHLAAELRAKGVDMTIINQVLSTIDETGPLEALIAKKSALSHDKLLGFLLRRGFKYENIISALKDR